MVVIGTPAAYALARFPLWRRDDLLLFVLATRLAPPVALVIPFYLIYAKVGLLDTYAGLIAAYLTFNLSFYVWVLWSFCRDLPVELEEAARADGYPRWQVLVRIVLPLLRSGIIATAVLCFVFAWNEFLYAFMLGGPAVETLPVAVPKLITSQGVKWGELAIVGIAALVPVLVVVFVLQRHLIAGSPWAPSRAEESVWQVLPVSHARPAPAGPIRVAEFATAGCDGGGPVVQKARGARRTRRRARAPALPDAGEAAERVARDSPPAGPLAGGGDHSSAHASSKSSRGRRGMQLGRVALTQVAEEVGLHAAVREELGVHLGVVESRHTAHVQPQHAGGDHQVRPLERAVAERGAWGQGRDCSEKLSAISGRCGRASGVSS